MVAETVSSSKQRQSSLKKAAELALVFVCGGVMLLGVARRVERTAAAAAPTASAEVAPSSPAPAPAAPSGSARPYPQPVGEDDASCAIPDRGLGEYGAAHGLPIGYMIAPPIEGDRYDVLLHLHGGEAARRVVAPENLDLVIATVDEGVGSQVYANAFYGPEPLEELLEAVGRQMEPKILRHLIISSWSAGYGGVREILLQHPTVASAVILLDSVHAGYESDGATLREGGLEPFVNLAHRALAGETTMVLTHSDIRPPTFASTTEVADYLLGKIDGRRAYAGLVETFGVEHKTAYERGDLIVRGYTGTTKGAHCAHLRMLAGILKNDVLPRLSDG
jgi:hypothetical protein